MAYTRELSILRIGEGYVLWLRANCIFSEILCDVAGAEKHRDPHGDFNAINSSFRRAW
jgi:hypothetical protein